MISTKTDNTPKTKKEFSFLKLDMFSPKVFRLRPVFLALFTFGLMVIFYLAVLNPEIIFSIITGFALFVAGFFMSNLFYLNASGKKEDDFNRTIIKNTSDSLLLFHVRKGKFKFVSPAIEKMLGYDLTSVVNRYDLSFVHPADRFELYNILDKDFLQFNRNFVTTLRMIKRDGTIIWVAIKGDVIVDASNKMEWVVMNLRDVTEEKEQAMAQRQYQKSLEQSIQKNNSKSHEYEEIADLMSSYDLKEPLRTVSSYSQLVQHRYADRLDNDGREFLQYTVDGANRMARMMDDILSFSNIRLDQMKPREINVNKAIREVQHVLANPIKASGATINVGELPNIQADFIQFKQLLKNLLENAIKFKGVDAPIIDLDLKAENGNWVFSIKDNGIGLLTNHHAAVFDVFGKIKGSGKAAGSGVGLAVCKKIVKNHGGKIWVNSKGIGQGCTFYFSLPMEMENAKVATKGSLKKESFQPALTFKKLKLHM